MLQFPALNLDERQTFAECQNSVPPARFPEPERLNCKTVRGVAKVCVTQSSLLLRPAEVSGKHVARRASSWWK